MTQLRRFLAVLRHPLPGTITFMVLWALFVKFLLPYLGGWLASSDMFSIRRGLPSSGKELSLYMTLAALATLCFLMYNGERWRRCQEPVWVFLRWKHPFQRGVLIALPLVIGAMVFLVQSGTGSEPVANPILHPTPPDQFSKLRNPFRNPSGEMLAEFDAALLAGEIDAEASTEADVIAYAKALSDNEASEADRLRAFRRHVIEEGRVLFMINCRPCHGAGAMGDGPMSVGQRRVPLDFTGVETIATLVEGAVFWRVKKGGIKLPREGAPWESAMPSWEADLTDEQIWKVIMADYDIAGNAPRESEGFSTETTSEGNGPE